MMRRHYVESGPRTRRHRQLRRRGGRVPMAAATPEAAAPAAALRTIGRNATATTTATITAAAAAATTKAKLGMSASQATWAQRVREVGTGSGGATGLRARSLTGGLGVATQACKDGMYPVISFKAGSWSAVASGAQDAALRSLATRLAALPCDVFATLAHEPDGDGTPAQWCGHAGSRAAAPGRRRQASRWV